MNFPRIFLSAVFALKLAAVLPAEGASGEGHFGVCQPTSKLNDLFPKVSWVRLDLPWGKCEPKEGEWSEEYLQEWIQRALVLQEQGHQVLPVLCYNTDWSWDRGPRTFRYGNRTFTYKPLEDGRFQEKKVIHRKSGDKTVTKEIKGNNRFPLDPRYAKAWENYVERVVKALSSSPLKTRYFEIWNEAHPDSGFWSGSMDDYFTLIHLPAAKIIRQQGGLAVYGGWPCVGPLHEFYDLLDRNKAWDSIDVLNVHYFPLSAMKQLARVAKERTGGNMSVWQTEIGFTTESSFVSNFCPRFLYWSLIQPDENKTSQKVFYFAEGSPDSASAYGYGKCLRSGDLLTDHGKSFSVFLDLFERPDMRTLDSLRSVPAFAFSTNENHSSWECFETKDSYLIAVHVALDNPSDVVFDEATGDTFQPKESEVGLRIIVPAKLSPKVGSAVRISCDGTRTDIVPAPLPDGTVEVEVPWFLNDSPLENKLLAEGMLTFYVRIGLKETPSP